MEDGVPKGFRNEGNFTGRCDFDAKFSSSNNRTGFLAFLPAFLDTHALTCQGKGGAGYLWLALVGVDNGYSAACQSSVQKEEGEPRVLVRHDGNVLRARVGTIENFGFLFCRFFFFLWWSTLTHFNYARRAASQRHRHCHDSLPR